MKVPFYAFAMTLSLASAIIPSDIAPNRLGGLKSERFQDACNTLTFEYNQADLVDIDNPVGKTQRVQVNVPRSSSAPGEYILQVTDIIGDDGNNHCVFSGSINLEMNQDGQFDNQIIVQGSCDVDSNAVIGGTGIYNGIYGRQYFQKGTPYPGKIEVVVEYCNI